MEPNMEYESEFEYLKYLYFILKHELVPKDVHFQLCPSHWTCVIVPIAESTHITKLSDENPHPSEMLPVTKIQIDLRPYTTPHGIRHMGYCKETNILYIRDINARKLD
jgi:hypothetical protein